MLENFQRIVRETVEDAKVNEAEQLLGSGMLEKLVDSKTEAAEKQLFLEKLRRALQEARDAVMQQKYSIEDELEKIQKECVLQNEILGGL